MHSSKHLSNVSGFLCQATASHNLQLDALEKEFQKRRKHHNLDFYNYKGKARGSVYDPMLWRWVVRKMTRPELSFTGYSSRNREIVYNFSSALMVHSIHGPPSLLSRPQLG